MHAASVGEISNRDRIIKLKRGREGCHQDKTETVKQEIAKMTTTATVSGTRQHRQPKERQIQIRIKPEF